MSETKVVVPEGMLKAVYEHIRAMGGDALANDIRVDLEAALRWLSENPIVPTDEQAHAIEKECPYVAGTPSSIKWYIEEWQRRMFRAPEPEVPEATRITGCVHGSTLNQPPCVPCAQAIEAYRRSKP